MDIALFVVRMIFTVLIYVFIFSLLYYLIKDLQNTGVYADEIIGITLELPDEGDVTSAAVSRKNEVGALKVELAPAEYGIQGMEFPLRRDLKLGRDDDNDLILPGAFVSGQHARLYLQDGQYWLEDLGSKNGTFLNCVPISVPTVLANGDQIAIGDITLRFVRWGYEVESDHQMRPGTS